MVSGFIAPQPVHLDSPTIRTGIRKIVLGKRYETFSMHHMLQGIAPDQVPWLSSSPEASSRINASENVKRRQLVEELLFWLYDGFLIPLIRVRHESVSR